MSYQEPTATRPTRRPLARASAALLLAGAVALGALAIGTRGSSGSEDLVPAQGVPAAAPSLLVGIPPERVLDTRATDGGPIGVPSAAPIGPAGQLDVQIAGVGSVPAGATSVSVNITIDDDATTQSFLSVWPTGEPIAPTSASINNAEPGIITQNTALLKLGTGGRITIYNHLGAVNVIVDVTGYFVPGVAAPTTVPPSTTTTAASTTTTAGSTTTAASTTTTTT